MKKLKIINKDKYLYTLKDHNNNKYIFNIEFQDIDIISNTNDYIYMSEKLLYNNNKEYSNVYTFGSLYNNYGKKVDNYNSPDIIRIAINNKTTYLKRLCGEEKIP